MVNLSFVYRVRVRGSYDVVCGFSNGIFLFILDFLFLVIFRRVFWDFMFRFS